MSSTAPNAIIAYTHITSPQPPPHKPKHSKATAKAPGAMAAPAFLSGLITTPLPPWEVVVKLLLLQTGLALVGGLALARLMAWRGSKRYPRITAGAVLLTGVWGCGCGLEGWRRWGCGLVWYSGVWFMLASIRPHTPPHTHSSASTPTPQTKNKFNRHLLRHRADGRRLFGAARVHGAGGRAQGAGRQGTQGSVG